jgi:hypothetical protein
MIDRTKPDPGSYEHYYDLLCEIAEEALGFGIDVCCIIHESGALHPERRSRMQVIQEGDPHLALGLFDRAHDEMRLWIRNYMPKIAEEDL